MKLRDLNEQEAEFMGRLRERFNRELHARGDPPDGDDVHILLRCGIAWMHMMKMQDEVAAATAKGELKARGGKLDG